MATPQKKSWFKRKLEDFFGITAEKLRDDDERRALAAIARRAESKALEQIPTPFGSTEHFANTIIADADPAVPVRVLKGQHVSDTGALSPELDSAVEKFGDGKLGQRLAEERMIAAKTHVHHLIPHPGWRVKLCSCGAVLGDDESVLGFLADARQRGIASDRFHRIWMVE